jgi:rRNA pseudouridine-1189 N-methylase Emg1 (Nep1/Mra1 family)
MEKIAFNISCLFLCSFFAFQKNSMANIVNEICDTVMITAKGKGNLVKIDSLYFEGEFNAVIEGEAVKGEIRQKGEDNNVEIKSEITKRQKQTVEIKQTGKNNEVKINSK